MKRPAQILFLGVLVVVATLLTVGSQGSVGLAATPPVPPPTRPVKGPPRDITLTPVTTEVCCGETGNPFGILIGLTSPERADVVKSLGAAYFRPNQALVVDKWDGTCPECDLALQRGLKLILTVKASGSVAQNPSSPPKDIAAYQKTLADMLDKYPPEVLVVENEENSTLYLPVRRKSMAWN